MEIKALESDDKDICKLKFEGEMTIYAAATTHQEMNELCADFNSFDIDLSEVDEIDTTGVQILLALKAQVELKEGSLVLSNITPAIKDVLEVFEIKSMFKQAA